MVLFHTVSGCRPVVIVQLPLSKCKDAARASLRNCASFDAGDHDFVRMKDRKAIDES